MDDPEKVERFLHRCIERTGAQTNVELNEMFKNKQHEKYDILQQMLREENLVFEKDIAYSTIMIAFWHYNSGAEQPVQAAASFISKIPGEYRKLELPDIICLCKQGKIRVTDEALKNAKKYCDFTMAEKCVIKQPYEFVPYDQPQRLGSQKAELERAMGLKPSVSTEQDVIEYLFANRLKL